MNKRVEVPLEQRIMFYASDVAHLGPEVVTPELLTEWSLEHERVVADKDREIAADDHNLQYAMDLLSKSDKRTAKLHKRIKQWRKIADEMEVSQTTMTANTHRLFANELAAIVGEPESENDE